MIHIRGEKQNQQLNKQQLVYRKMKSDPEKWAAYQERKRFDHRKRLLKQSGII
jgi:hypothetical protein